MYIIFLKKYTNNSVKILILIFLLTGLPPVGLFFFKVNIFILIFENLNLIVIAHIFIIFYISMLYYLQIFVNKNTSLNFHLFIKKNIFKNKSNKLKSKSCYTFNIIYFTNINILFYLLGFFYFSDIIYIINMIMF